MISELNAEIAEARESAQVSDCFCCAGLLVPRLLAALELAIEQRDRWFGSFADAAGSETDERIAQDAAILAALRGEA